MESGAVTYLDTVPLIMKLAPRPELPFSLRPESVSTVQVTFRSTANCDEQQILIPISEYYRPESEDEL